MKLYRFSPIKSKKELLKAIEHIHLECYKLCKTSFGKYLPNAGNVGVFCHYDDEYEYLTGLRKEMTEPSESVDQKYFKLHENLVIPAKNDIPETIYSFLYVRRLDPYRAQVGDIDFYLKEKAYTKLKQEMLAGKKVPGARIFERPDLDMIELFNSDSDALGYVSTEYMSDLVRVKQSEHTKL